MDKEIGISSASKMLGISISTLKRLCDENLVPSVRTPGGHRRFDRAAVQLAGQRLVGHTMRPIPACSADQVDCMHSWLLAGKESRLDQMIQDHLASGLSLPDIFDQSFVPAVRALSYATTTSKTIKQLALRRAVRVLDRLSLSTAGDWPGTPVALGASVGHAVDEVASKAVEVTLRSGHIHALHLESQANIKLLTKAVSQLSARAVWLAQMQGQPMSELVRAARELRSALPGHIRVFMFCGQPAANIDESSLDKSSLDESSIEMPIYSSLQMLFLREGSALFA